MAAEIEHFIPLLVIAIALGMDAFSLGIGLGISGIRWLAMMKLSLLVGVFHVVMPLMGMVMGTYFSSFLGSIAGFIGGGLLVLLGLHMIYNAVSGEIRPTVHFHTIWGLLFFALIVSIDSFSVGISLGLFSVNMIFVILLFGFIGGLMSIIGLLLGTRVSSSLGVYGEAIGGIILLLFGIKFIV